MITKTFVKTLREDATIQTLLGATGSSDCPVFTTQNFDETVTKQINISLEYGETLPWSCAADIHDGRVLVYILVKDTESGAINTSHTIASRILELLDLKGSVLNDTSTVYWVQKLDSDFTHYDDIHFYELLITFRFVIKES